MECLDAEPSPPVLAGSYNHKKPRIIRAVATCGFFPEIFSWILLGVLFCQEGKGWKCCWLMWILSSPLPQKNNHIAVALRKSKDKWAPLPADTVAVLSVTSQSSPEKRNHRLFTGVMTGRRLNWSNNRFSPVCVGFDFLVSYKGHVC